MTQSLCQKSLAFVHRVIKIFPSPRYQWVNLLFLEKKCDVFGVAGNYSVFTWIGLADPPFHLLVKVVKTVTSIFQHSNPSFSLLYFKWQKEYSPRPREICTQRFAQVLMKKSILPWSSKVFLTHQANASVSTRRVFQLSRNLEFERWLLLWIKPRYEKFYRIL